MLFVLFYFLFKCINIEKNFWGFTISLSTPFCGRPFQSTIKTIGYSIIKDSFTLLWNTAWSASRSAKNVEETDHNGRKYLKLIIFQMFQHSSMPTKITKQSKNNWACKYLWHSYHFMQFQYKTLLYIPKSLRERAQMAKNTTIWVFFISFSTSAYRPGLQS